MISIHIYIVFYAGAKSVICFKCNSKYDSRCGDPFIKYDIGLVDCNITDVPSHLQGKEPMICRKTVQRSKLNNYMIYININ